MADTVPWPEGYTVSASSTIFSYPHAYSFICFQSVPDEVILIIIIVTIEIADLTLRKPGLLLLTSTGRMSRRRILIQFLSTEYL